MESQRRTGKGGNANRRTERERGKVTTQWGPNTQKWQTAGKNGKAIREKSGERKSTRDPFTPRQGVKEDERIRFHRDHVAPPPADPYVCTRIASAVNLAVFKKGVPAHVRIEQVRSG